MTAVAARVRQFLAAHPVSFRVLVAPGISQGTVDALASRLPDATFLPWSPGVLVAPGPMVSLVAPSDLRAPYRTELLALIVALRPGRPVLYGGAGDKGILLEAINHWEVHQVVASTESVDALVGPLRRAQEELREERGIEAAVEELEHETVHLESALHELQSVQRQLLHTERLSALGRLAGGLIRAMRQHLRALERFEEVARPHCMGGDLQVLVDYAFESIRSVGALLDDMTAYADGRVQDCAVTSEPLDAVVDHVLQFARFDRIGRKRTVERQLQSDAHVRIERHRVIQVLINLLRNAFQATEEGAPIAVRTFGEVGTAHVEVEDWGTGMPREVVQRIFEPFFSTKGDGGMGLGLAVSRAAIERQGGRITVHSEPGVGTRFRVSFPSEPPSTA